MKENVEQFLCSIYVGEIPLVEKALKLEGVDINVNDGWPLRMSSSLGKEDLIGFLVENGASVSEFGAAACLSAASAGHWGSVSKLLGCEGFEMSRSVAHSLLPLAAKSGHEHSLSLCLGFVDKDERVVAISLLNAIKNENLGCVDRLVRHGASLNYKSPEGENALLDALKHEDVMAVKLLSRLPISEKLKSEALGLGLSGQMEDLLARFKVEQPSVVDTSAVDAEHANLLSVVRRKTPPCELY